MEKNIYALKITDEASGRCSSIAISTKYTGADILDSMERDGLLSFPKYKCYIRELPGDSSKIPLCDTKIEDGATLHIEYNTGDEEYLCLRGAACKKYKTYELNFILPNGEKISRKCYGYERPDDITNQLIIKGILKKRFRIDNVYSISNWPRFDQEVLNELLETNFSYRYRLYSSTYLCDFDPADGTTYIVHEEQRPSTVCLYGCPTANLIEEKELLECKVEVIKYE